MWFGERFIRFMRRRNIGETARDASIDPFGEKKVGVPSMGGIIIIVAILVPTLLLGRLRNIYTILMIVTTLWFGLIGFLDDYIKIFKKNKEGLAGKWKILGQVIMGLIVGLTLYLSPDAVIRENVERARVGDKVEIVHKSEAVKSTKTNHSLLQKQQLRLCRCCRFSRRTQTSCRLGSLRSHGHHRHHSRVQRSQPQRRYGRHGRRKQCLHLHCPRHTRLCVEPHRVCLLPQHYVRTRFARTGRFHLRHGWCTHRLLVV